MRVTTIISTLTFAVAATATFATPATSASAAERTTLQSSTTDFADPTTGGRDGAKGGNVEFEWKVEEGES